MKFTIKQLIMDDDENYGVKAISLVDDPAIETNFLFFNKEKPKTNLFFKNEIKLELLNETPGGSYIRDFYHYTAQPEPEIIETSHDFCRHKAGNIYHISEIQSWGKLNENEKKEYGFNTESNFFASFNGVGSFNVNDQIFNCRHWLRRVNGIDEIPEYKRRMKFSKDKSILFVDFKVSNKEKREVEGLVLQSGQFIFRDDLDGNPGFVYFTRETVRKIMKKYGFNRSITIQHKEDITGTSILMDSWLIENEEDNKTQWFVKYKIINDKLWDVIKKGLVKGFSLEGIFSFK